MSVNWNSDWPKCCIGCSKNVIHEDKISKNRSINHSHNGQLENLSIAESRQYQQHPPLLKEKRWKKKEGKEKKGMGKGREGNRDDKGEGRKDLDLDLEHSRQTPNVGYHVDERRRRTNAGDS